MKKVLIVGADSYIGCSFERYVQGRFDVVTVDVRNDEWRNADFKGFDSVLFVAGIAHRKQSADNKDLYYAVNRDLALSVAEKARDESVGQFIYLSSMAVYGILSGEITEHQIPKPLENDYYGLSKYQAELLLEELQVQDFKIAIVRSPMVYGPGCKGKFQQLVKIAQKTPIIPIIKNKRSMIFIDNFVEFLAILVQQEVFGILCPHNEEYICTSTMLTELSKGFGRSALRLRVPGFIVKLLMGLSSSAKNAFGNLYYSPNVAKMPFDDSYQMAGFEESIRKCIELGKG